MNKKTGIREAAVKLTDQWWYCCLCWMSHICLIRYVTVKIGFFACIQYNKVFTKAGLKFRIEKKKSLRRRNRIWGPNELFLRFILKQTFICRLQNPTQNILKQLSIFENWLYKRNDERSRKYLPLRIINLGLQQFKLTFQCPMLSC